MECRWCNTDYPGQILIEEVCLACIIEDIVDPEKLIQMDAENN